MSGGSPNIFWAEEATLAGRVGTMARPPGGAELPSAIRALRRAGVTTLVSMLTDAESRELHLDAQGAICAACDVRFLRLPVADFGVPPSMELAYGTLAPLVERISAGGAIVFHCRGGVGRSSLAAIALLALCGVALPLATRTLEQARGQSVPETKEQVAWLHRFAQTYAER